MDLYLHTDVSKYRYIQSVNLLFTTVSPSIYSLSVDGSATVKQAGWLHNETIQKKSQIPTIYLVLKQKVVSSIVPICSFCLFPFHSSITFPNWKFWFISSLLATHLSIITGVLWAEREEERDEERGAQKKEESEGGKKREKREGTNQQDAKVRQRESFLMSSEIHREISRRESVGNMW